MESFTTQSATPLLQVRHQVDSNYKSMFAARDIEADAVLVEYGFREVLRHPTRYSVQTDMDRHIHLAPEYLQYINHSCDPNVFFDHQTMTLRALRPIKKGEAVEFFYPSTEWSMAEAFDCLCKSEKCLGRVQGAAFLDDEMLGEHQLSRYIRDKLSQRSPCASPGRDE